jgi:SAM-dependent methyltransferase
MSHALSVTPERDPTAAPGAVAVKRCPACDAPGSRTIHRLTDPSGRIAGVFELRRCAGCEVVYVSPRPSDEALTALYDEDFYFSTGWSYDALAEWFLEAIQAQRRGRVERHVRPPGRLLDIGCGDGRFVHHMARHGWDAIGLDFSPSALAYARRKSNGARFAQGTLDDFACAPGRLDLVTLWQVLEHIGEPRPLLRRCHALLRSGGVFVAAVPNIEGLSARLAGERWWGLDVPRHLVLYSPATLCRSLEHAGFRVLRVRHRSFQYDPYGLLHSTLDWVFTRRHFLSDFAKRNPMDDVRPSAFAYNVAALVALAPLLAPACLATTTVGALVRQGGFIEVHARRE